MPTHVYLPSRESPTWWDRVLVHPTEHAIAVLALTLGLLLCIAFPATGVLAFASMAVIPEWLIALSGTALMIGGFTALRGLHWTGDRVSLGWSMEQSGWALIAGGLLAPSLTGLIVGISPASAILPGILAAGAVLRWLSLSLLRKEVRKAVNKDRDAA